MEPPTVLPKTVRLPAGPHATRAAADPGDSTELDHRSLGDGPALPEVGTTFAGFTLIRELGRGSFGRAYLARQADLADRPVVLKVAVDAGRESRTLAQLQHSAIVPIHSAHRVGPLHAICMPYYGATTLADVTRELFAARSGEVPGPGVNSTLRARATATLLRNPAAPPAGPGVPGVTDDPSESARSGLRDVLARGESVEAVLWLAARLAGGLAHAHKRGIVHRDLKPANVLLADGGRPMLLDFNLAEPARPGRKGRMGGTLPYMSPEQLEAFTWRPRAVDHRTDLYSLGVILFELLTGRHPFRVPTEVTQETPKEMHQDRLGPPPSARVWNRRVSPSVESIVRHCLEPNPDDRYQSAGELAEDIDRHLNHRPLRYAAEPSVRERFRKWRWRHPSATAAVGAGLAALVVVGMQLARWF